MIFENREMIRKFIHKRWRLHKEDKICFNYLKNRKDILDIGCGVGKFMEWFNGDQILGIDANIHSINICKHKGLNVRNVNALSMNFDNKFDAIHCSHLIEHFYPTQVHGFLKDVDSLLKPGGLLIIRTPLLWDGFYDDLSHIRPYNPAVLIRYLTGNNFQQKSFMNISSNYKVVRIIYRYLPLKVIKSPKNKCQSLTRFIFDFLAFIGIHSFKKDAYIIIFRKNE